MNQCSKEQFSEKTDTVRIFCARITERNSSAPLLKQVLAGPCGLSEKVEILRTPQGRPYTDLPTDLCFSVSHTGSLWVCAVGHQPLGVDVEFADRPVKDPMRLARRFFSVAEQEALAAAGASSAAFLRLWTRKEAFLKLQGTGFFHAPAPEERRTPEDVFYCEDPKLWQALEKEAGRPVVPGLCTCAPVARVTVVAEEAWRRR